MEELRSQKGDNWLNRIIHKGISGSTIKLIAIITMFIDHVGATIVNAMVKKQYDHEAAAMIFNADGYYPVFDSMLFHFYNVLRAIGRIGFPCFCFLLIEGFIHTRSRGKYIVRLGLFAFLSEIPFDLAFKQEVLEFTYQNVFFTLFLGMVVITIIDYLLQKEGMHVLVKGLASIAVFIGGIAAAIYLKTDYDALGVLTITVMYFLRRNRNACMYGGCMTLTAFQLQEGYAFLGMIPIALYNGKRGLNLKYVFYLFYPVHLLFLFGICKFCGLY
ncbi:TraX family protein [Anaerosporobacter faecicola]|uniref:TraX family protein n=1 Tax=Anaerosporobacter faecicola TaxID=2718714 RepID=UPI001EE57E2D|nr:TraX family protein [Anaerosporobacter faecicola]